MLTIQAWDSGVLNQDVILYQRNVPFSILDLFCDERLTECFCVLCNLSETPCSQLCCWAGPPEACGGVTMEVLASVFTHPTPSWTREEEGMKMLFRQIPVCYRERFPLQWDHHPDFGEHCTVGRGHSDFQLLQLWIRHQRPFSHTSDWWD